MEQGEGEPIKEIYIATRTGGERKHQVPEAEKEKAETEIQTKTGEGWLKVDLDKITNEELRGLVMADSRARVSMLDSEELKKMHHEIALLKEVPDDEMTYALGAIEDYFNAHFTSEEYMTERIPPPETIEDWVKTTIERTFTLIDRGINEEKNFEEMFDEHQALRRLIKRDCPERMGPSLDQIGDNKEVKERNKELNEYLKGEYSQGVYLKERLEIFIEAARRLHKRYREVIKADGSLAGLRVMKVSEGFSAEIVTQLTELRPIDWYVLTHLDDLFPDGGKDKESRIGIEKAWYVWQKIGSHPYEKNSKGKWEPKKIKINDNELPYTLVDYFKDEKVVKEVRNRIGDFVGRRAEQLAHMFLTVGLTYDMWDRERWKIQTVGEARDLMHFDFKRIHRLQKERSGEGPEWTVGLFWAEENQDNPGETFFGFSEEELKENNPKLWKALSRVRERLAKNKDHALFVNSRAYPSTGELVGDYWHTAFHDVDNEVQTEKAKKKGEPDKRRKTYAEYICPRNVPWLGLSSIEAKSYASYFGYSLAVAKGLRDLIMETGYDKPDELMEVKFWRNVNDLTHRLIDYCPWLLGKNRDKDDEWMTTEAREKARWQKTMKMRRLIAEGILYTGSYLASSKPDLPLSKGKFSREEVWGKKVFLVAGVHGGIMGAIELSGGLDDNNLAVLRKVVVKDFDFHGKGGRR